MEGSVEDTGAPDSWETADLDDSVSRLMISCKTSAAPAPNSSGSGFADEPLAKAVDSSSSVSASGNSFSSASAASERSLGLSEELLGQVDQFLREALQNPRERISVLRMEQDVLKFIRDPSQQQLEFQQLPTSYLRLAAHRVAQHYYLQSMVIPDSTSPDGSGTKIIVRKISECRLPLVRLADIPLNVPQETGDNVLKLAIKQRPQKHSQSLSSSKTNSSKAGFAKSVEERKEEYNRARARIFSSSSTNNASSGGKPECGDVSTNQPDSFSSSLSLPSPTLDGRSGFEGPEINLGGRLFYETSSTGSSSRSGRSRTEKEFVTSRYSKPNPKVAIFRDREVDKKDPDYDRNYERYVQRFDPGFGFTGGAYSIQPLYAPALNYNTEFPQLGATSHRPPQMPPLEPRPLPQHPIHGPWGATTNTPPAIGYGPPENMMAPPPPFSPGHIGAHSTSAMYHLQSSQYTRPGMSYIHPHEHAHQPFPQSLQQQHEASFGLARPR